MDSARFWLVLVALLGAVVGSFLNVVIYRLPLGLSVTNPRWSFCPRCRGRIRPYDNIPILSWLCLRGRCRSCDAPIPLIYPLIECLTALLFITVWDAMFTAQMVPGIETLGANWPSAVAYLALFGSLLAGAAMDIESYIIDIRVCILAVIVGVIGHGLNWGLSAVSGASSGANLPTVMPPALCVIGVAMGGAWLITSLIVAWVSPWRGDVRNDVSSDAGHIAGEQDLSTCASPGEAASQSAGRFQPFPIVVLLGLTLALLAWQLFAADGGFVERLSPGGQRGFAGCFIFMVVLVLAAMIPRQADTQIIEEIEAERAGARRVAIHELVWFIPSIAAGMVVAVLLRRSGHMGDDWQAVLHGLFGDQQWALFLAGGFQALGAACLAAGIGWIVRILGTLAFGKEAFGTGDIYIMAAIGAVAGLPLLFFAFFLGALLALVGVLATIFHKSSRAIPFGPWLAMGSLAGLWLQPVLLGFFKQAAAMVWAMIIGRAEAWSIGG